MSTATPAALPAASDPADSRARWLPRAVLWGTIVFVLSMVATRWDARTGFTSLLRFGEEFEDRRIPAVESLPVALLPNRGYDGQFYAQLAVTPQPFDPVVQEAMVNPAYRSRRILLPLVAHVLGGRDPWLVLHAYAMLNIAAWLVACWSFWRIIAPEDGRSLAVWTGCVLSLGVLDSVRMALTDLPALVLMLAAVLLAQRARHGWAVVVLALGALVRETAALSVAAFDRRRLLDRSSWRVHVRNGLLVAAPIAVWTALLVGRVPADDPLGARNLYWPGITMVHYAAEWAAQIASGDLDSRYIFGLCAIVSYSWQATSLLSRANDPSPWIRFGLPFAVLFWFLGDAVWHGYWAVARACLPMTIAYNLTLPRDRSFAWKWALGNVSLLHSVYRLLPDL